MKAAIMKKNIAVLSIIAIMTCLTAGLSGRESKSTSISYTSINEIQKDGKAAIGKYASLKLSLISIATERATFIDGSGNYIRVHFSRHQKGRVRRMKRETFYTITVKVRDIAYDGEIILDFM